MFFALDIRSRGINLETLPIGFWAHPSDGTSTSSGMTETVMNWPKWYTVSWKKIPWQFSGFLPERICEYVWSIWAHVNSLWTLWCPKTYLKGKIRKTEFMAEIQPTTWHYKNQWDQLTIYDIYELRLGGLDCRQGKDMIPFTQNHWKFFKVVHSYSHQGACLLWQKNRLP